MSAEVQAEPDRVVRLYTWTYWDQICRQHQTLDCSAVDRTAAFRSARRFMGRLNRRRAKIGAPRVQVPQHEVQMRDEVAHWAEMQALRARREAGRVG